MSENRWETPTVAHRKILRLLMNCPIMYMGSRFSVSSLPGVRIACQFLCQCMSVLVEQYEPNKTSDLFTWIM